MSTRRSRTSRRASRPTACRRPAKVTLEPSTVGGLEITSATIDGDYRDSTADIRTFEIVGRDVNVQASGTLALNETGQSNLTVHADSPSLEEIGKLLDQPLSGIGMVDVTVTGNRRELQAVGTVVGNGVKYGTDASESRRARAVERLHREGSGSRRRERAASSATTQGTFVTIAGQNINELTAKTDYVNKQVTFDATAKQPQRSLAAAGSLVLHPDHQEVHLQQLALATQGMTWQTVPGSEATIQYGNDAVTVKRLRAGERRSADCRRRHVRAPGRLAERDGEQRRCRHGRRPAAQAAAALRAASTPAERSPERPTRLQAKAAFAIEQGGFRQFRYDSFGGTVNYAGKGVTLDTKLQQNPTTWIEAKGRGSDGAVRRRTGCDLERADRSPHRQHADRCRDRPGFHDRADRRHGDARGARPRDRLGRRSPPRRRRDDPERRVHARAERRHLHGSRRPDRSAARSHPHRTAPGARQPAAAR